MTTPVIVRTETFIPRNGGPVVYQVYEEVEVSPGRWISLDPRNPTPEEVQSADDKAIAQQQATIAAITAERDSLTQQLATMTTERDSALSEKASLQTLLDSANATIKTLTSNKAAIETANAELQTSVSTLTGERDSAVSQLEVANERIATLETRIAELTAEPEVPIVSRRQAQLALLEMGLLDTVEKAVNEGPRVLRIEYEGPTWMANNPVLVAMAKELGMSDEQIVQFFALAGTL